MCFVNVRDVMSKLFLIYVINFIQSTTIQIFKASRVISLEEEGYILSKAYVPEHIVSLMVLISKGEPYLINDHLCYVKGKYSHDLLKTKWGGVPFLHYEFCHYERQHKNIVEMLLQNM